MKFFRLKAKTTSPTQAEMDSMKSELLSCRNQIMELKQKNAQLESELLTEKKNHALMTCGMEMWQKDALEAQQALRKEQGSAKYWREKYEWLRMEYIDHIHKLQESLEALDFSTPFVS